MRRSMDNKNKPSKGKVEGKILVLLEYQKPVSFETTAPQFPGIFVYGEWTSGTHNIDDHKMSLQEHGCQQTW